MKKNKCDNCLVGIFYNFFGIDIAHEYFNEDIIKYFNYCPACRT